LEHGEALCTQLVCHVERDTHVPETLRPNHEPTEVVDRFQATPFALFVSLSAKDTRQIETERDVRKDQRQVENCLPLFID